MAGIALPLQDFIASLDPSSLPKILQICSGVYFQGSVYEISGSEVSFSTGDLIKVIGIELQSVSCEDVANKETFELPVSHAGLFKVVPEQMPYSSVEEMMSLRPVGQESFLPFTFHSHTKMTLDTFTLGAGKALTVIAIEKHEGKEDQVRCHVKGEAEASAEVRIPLSSRGQFYECESEECYTLKEIMSSPFLRSRRFCLVKKTNCERVLVLSPVYQIQAIMNLRKNVLRFPSSLEVDVVDVSDLCKDVHFMTPLSLKEVLSRPDESLPGVVEILEEPHAGSLFKCNWLQGLTKRAHLVLHKKGTKAMALLSSMKGRKAQQFFLVSQQYGGRIRRRPRDFNSVYELYVASTQTKGLTVSVTRNCEEVEEEGLPGLSVGERLEIVSCTRMDLPGESSKKQKQSIEALLCHRVQDPDDVDDEEEEEEKEEEEVKQLDEKEEVRLPLYMQGHFVEVLGDNKKYKLSQLGKEFSLPLDVKVVSRDTELESDPLVGFPCLRIEGAMLEPTIQASFLDKPDYCFELPANWLSMSVCYTEEPLPWPDGQCPKSSVEWVTEVSEKFFYEFQKQRNSGEAPPPRPPKRDLSSSKSSKARSKPAKKSSKHQDKITPTEQFSAMTLNKKRAPAPPPPDGLSDEPPTIVPRKHLEVGGSAKALPNMYIKMNQPKTRGPTSDVTACVDSDHDYETLDESLASMVKSAQESVAFLGKS
ncbi:protein THEMIS2 isoform X1 [Nothobranchius furzeri]|uniref:Thymocyte selection associated family member 2 n=2 Tax=Nothobranchius furzeri TaxID=105023 RepID=A0A9D2YTS1_NOTFU|nr:protein THEMIS2 [Nothobranchius furzeri]KAF7226861.1 thymocyte selection associated family member 2 [Nothobranchius furzeri]